MCNASVHVQIQHGMSMHGLYVLNMTFLDLPAKKYANLQRSTGFLNNMILSTKLRKALLAYRFTCYQGKFTLFSNCTVGVRPCVLSKSNLLAVSFETTSEIAVESALTTPYRYQKAKFSPSLCDSIFREARDHTGQHVCFVKGPVNRLQVL